MMLFWGMKENTHASDKGKEKRTIRPWRGRQFRATSPSIPREEEDPAHDHIICWDLPRRGSWLLPGEAFLFLFFKEKDFLHCYKNHSYILVPSLLCGSTQNWDSPVSGTGFQRHTPVHACGSFPNLLGPCRLASSAFFTLRTLHCPEGLQQITDSKVQVLDYYYCF